MPVVYVAVARRLGYPVKLVLTKEHLFFRWHDPRGTRIQWDHPKLESWIPPDRFNVEGAGEGIAFYPDAHYIQWPHLWKEADFDHGRYLRPLSTTDPIPTPPASLQASMNVRQTQTQAVDASDQAKRIQESNKRMLAMKSTPRGIRHS